MKKTKIKYPSEHEEQAAIFSWSERVEHLWPELRLLHGSLNGVRLTIGQAKKAKRAGLKRGFPDIFLPVARSKYHGLFIELKKEKGGSVSKDQKEILNLLCKQGYYACVCKGSKIAIEIIMRYLECDLPEQDTLPF